MPEQRKLGTRVVDSLFRVRFSRGELFRTYLGYTPQPTALMFAIAPAVIWRHESLRAKLRHLVAARFVPTAAARGAAINETIRQFTGGTADFGDVVAELLLDHHDR